MSAIDEGKTGLLLTAEGAAMRTRTRRLILRINMCDREALEPASRALGTPIYPIRTKGIACRPDLFPPDGKGYWSVEITGKRAEEAVERLRPHLTKEFLRKVERAKRPP